MQWCTWHSTISYTDNTEKRENFRIYCMSAKMMSWIFDHSLFTLLYLFNSKYMVYYVYASDMISTILGFTYGKLCRESFHFPLKNKDKKIQFDICMRFCSHPQTPEIKIKLNWIARNLKMLQYSWNSISLFSFFYFISFYSWYFCSVCVNVYV